MPDTTDRSVTKGSAASNRITVLSAGISTGRPSGMDSDARTIPPYPVAALIRRTRNAKSARDLHDIAFNGWEASMRLAVAVKPPADVTPLFEPSTGAWSAALRANLNDSKIDDPELIAVCALFSRVGAGINAAPMFVTQRMIFEYIAAYRNQLHGHGAVRGSDFYDSAGEILLHGLEAAWRRSIFLPENGELVFVQSVELDAAGQRRARIVLLKGGEPMLESRTGTTDIPDGLRPRRLYLREDRRYVSLHPWLLYDDKDERERVLYYNGRGKYLDFISGETPRVDKLQELYPLLYKELDALFRGKAATIFAEALEKNPNDFGDYEIICELGRGGMATVCLAKQKSLERRVALKMPLPGMANDPVAIQRFAREIQVLSQCDHPNVVKILDSGLHDGTPFYVMEYIEGADLACISQALSENESVDDAISNASLLVKTERARRLNLPPPSSPVIVPAKPATVRTRQELVQHSLERLAGLFRDAARGLHHLHEHGIIHRDIKPGNLMLTDGEHRIVVMDLGLAALANSNASLARDTATLLGTLRYMAPEQLQRQPIALDHRADIYSLCATFYELLSGKPFLDGVNEPQLLHQILYTEPFPLGAANPLVPRDIQMIVAKGIQKDPHLRYQSAEELARDLDRWLKGDPISARDPSLAYLLSLSIKKNKALVLTSIASLLLVVGFACLAVWTHQDLLLARNEQAQKLAEAERQSKRLVVLSSAKEQLLFGAVMENDGMFAQAKRNYESALASFAELNAPADEAENHLNLLYLRHRPPVFNLDGHRATGKHTGRIFNVAVSPLEASGDGRALSAGEESGFGVVKLWNLQTGQEISSHRTRTGDRVLSARFTPDGKKILFCGWLSKLNLWDTETGRVTPFPETKDPVASISFSNDGKYAATGSYNGSIRIWDIDKATQVDEQPAPNSVIRSILFIDDKTLCSAGSGGRISIWSLNAEHKLSLLRAFAAHNGGVNAMASVDHGKRLVSCGDDRLLKIWNTADGKEIDQAYGHPSEVTGLSVFEKDGHACAVSACGTTLRVWDLENVTEPQVVECGWHESAITSLALLSGGTRALTAAADGSLMLWNLPFQHSIPFDVYKGFIVRSLALSANAKLALASSESEFKVRLLDVDSGFQLREFDALKAPLRKAVFSKDEKAILAIDAEGSILEWAIDGDAGHAPSRVIRKDMPHPRLVAAAFSPDRMRAVVSTADGVVDVIDVPSGALVKSLNAGDAVTVAAASFSADGEKLVTSNMEGTLRLWEINSPRLPKPILSPGNSPVFGLELLPDGKRAIAGGMDFICRMWDLERGEEIRTFEGHTNSVYAVAYSPRKNQIATGSFDQSIRIWDAEDGSELYAFKSLKGSVFSLAFSNDGQALMYGCKNGRIEMLDFKLAAHVRQLQGRVEEAQRALKLRGDDVESLTRVGEWLSLQGAWADATAMLDLARRHSPGRFDAYALLGRGFWVQARSESAAEKKLALYTRAADAYQHEAERPDARGEALRFTLILSAIEAEKKSVAPNAK